MKELPAHHTDTRPWGQFEQFTLNELATVKILTVRAGEAFSLQTHEHRDEFWRILSGNGSAVIGDDIRAVHPGDSFLIPKGTVHRAEGGTEDLHILEISFGIFDEGDITRLDDKYGRI